MSWIHIDDIVGIFRLAIENAGASGPMNGTAPEPVRNADFARTFSEVLRTRYTPWRVYLPVGPPDALLRLLVGEVAGVITTGQRVVPAKAIALGYKFKYPHLADALRAIVEHKPPKPAGTRFTRPGHLIIDSAAIGGDLAEHDLDQKAQTRDLRRKRARA